MYEEKLKEERRTRNCMKSRGSKIRRAGEKGEEEGICHKIKVTTYLH